MVPIGRSEISATNYHYSVRNVTLKRSSYLFPGGSLKSRKNNVVFVFVVVVVVVSISISGDRGSTVVKVLCYKSKGL